MSNMGKYFDAGAGIQAIKLPSLLLHNRGRYTKGGPISISAHRVKWVKPNCKVAYLEHHTILQESTAFGAIL